MTPPTQLTLNGDIINNYQASAHTESKTDSATIKLTVTQKEALRAVAHNRGEGVSTLVGRAIEFYLMYMDWADKLADNYELVTSMLKKFK